MAYKNLSISKKKASFYQKSKEPKEGYEKVTYGTPPKDTYHSYQKNVKGTPNFFEIKEAEISGAKMKFLELSLKEGEDINKISVPLKNKTGYTDEAKAFISALVGYKMGEPVSISLVNKTNKGANGKEYDNLSVYINYENIKNDQGKGQSTGFIPYNDIPKGVEKIVAGDKTWDFTAQTEFYYSKIQEIEAKFKSSAASTSASTTTPEVESPVNDTEEFDEDTLPF